jgi:SsrA-binding protein
MSRKVVARNRRARFDYEILDTFEAGMVLLGSEVKSLRAGQASINEAYVAMRSNEAWLESMTIPPYIYSHLGGHDPTRTRKLLLQRREIDRIGARMREQGLTLIPTQVYFSNGKAKIELGLAKGKRRIDKRHAIKKREQEREMQRSQRRSR